MSPQQAAYLTWGLWGISWMAAALWTGRTVAAAGLRAEAPFRLATAAGSLLLFGIATGPRDLGWRAWMSPTWGTLAHPYWHAPAALEWALVGLSASGFAFAWWARVHLGRLWSADVTRKENHRVVDTGPYRMVRHPIYTGVIASALALALLKASAPAALGFLVFALSFAFKARLEERFLRAQLGAAAYDAYRRRTPMLVPFL